MKLNVVDLDSLGRRQHSERPAGARLDLPALSRGCCCHGLAATAGRYTFVRRYITIDFLRIGLDGMLDLAKGLSAISKACPGTADSGMLFLHQPTQPDQCHLLCVKSHTVRRLDVTFLTTGAPLLSQVAVPA
jgi:hypothetical protein